MRRTCCRRCSSRRPSRSSVPDLVGLTEDEARTAIGDAGLAVGDRTFEASEDVPKNQVIRQDPEPDEFVDPGTEIDIVVSEGKPQVEVPFVVGQQAQRRPRRARRAPGSR